MFVGMVCTEPLLAVYVNTSRGWNHPFKPRLQKIKPV
jgi:hypothetical protein